MSNVSKTINLNTTLRCCLSNWRFFTTFSPDIDESIRKMIKNCSPADCSTILALINKPHTVFFTVKGTERLHICASERTEHGGLRVWSNILAADSSSSTTRQHETVLSVPLSHCWKLQNSGADSTALFPPLTRALSKEVQCELNLKRH